MLGGTGKSGQYLVRHLINNGYSIRMLLRIPEKMQIQSDHIELVQGDARDTKAVYSLLEGCNYVISTLGQPRGEASIFSDATQNVIWAMKELKIKRYILITGISVDTPIDNKGVYAAAASAWMRANYPETTADKQFEWELLSASDLDWTLIRLPLIEFTDVKTEIKLSLEDCPGEKISATSLACFIVDQLDDPVFLRKAPFITNG